MNNLNLTPMLRRLSVYIGRVRLKFMSRQQVFNRIYQKNHWGDEESQSGSGSTLGATANMRIALEEIVSEHEIASILDIPCGDCHWMSHVDLPNCSYIGADIVPDLISENQKKHGTEIRQFMVLDLVEDQLPQVDLIICRDVFIHLSLDEIRAAMNNIGRSGARFVLASTYPKVIQNEEGVTGSWRYVNLMAPPFSLPDPIRMIAEEDATSKKTAKCAGLWNVRDLLN